MRLFSVTYVSSASRLLSDRELAQLVEKCADNNRTANITGVLLHKDGSFMQVLEGEEDAVNKVLLIIARDDRHRGLITLIRDPVTDRQFPGTWLGFVDCGARLLAATDGNLAKIESYFGSGFSGQPTKAQKLLLSFAKS